MALQVSTTITAGQYTGNVLLTLCRDAACTNESGMIASVETTFVCRNNPEVKAALSIAGDREWVTGLPATQ